MAAIDSFVSYGDFSGDFVPFGVSFPAVVGCRSGALAAKRGKGRGKAIVIQVYMPPALEHSSK